LLGRSEVEGTGAVQILTHTREKLQFVQKKNRKLAREVAELDTQLNSQRDGLSKVKQRRDKLRSAAHKMKEASVYIDNPMLLADIQHQRSIREELGADLDELQVLHTHCRPGTLCRVCQYCFVGCA
jgi:histone deacetylase 6